MFFRVTLLELIYAQLREEGAESCGVPPSVARFLAGSFQKGCAAVLTLATGSASSDEVQTVNQTNVSSLGLDKPIETGDGSVLFLVCVFFFSIIISHNILPPCS